MMVIMWSEQRYSLNGWLSYLKYELAFTNKWVYNSFTDTLSGGQFSVLSGAYSRSAVLTRGLQEFFAPHSMSDLVCFDNFGRFWRFGLILIFNSYAELSPRKQYIYFTPEGVPAETISDVVLSADWAEREAWELFGVYFSGHNDLRRLITDTAFKGHPMRRDYPMVGYYECWYTYDDGTVEYSKVEFMQEYRLFEFELAWKGGMDCSSLVADTGDETRAAGV